MNQRLIVRLLEKRGHRVVVAGNGAEALAALEKDAFDLILMDVQMPEMDGFEATAAIRRKEKNSGLHQIIVALTAHAMKGDHEKCLAREWMGTLANRSGRRNWMRCWPVTPRGSRWTHRPQKNSERHTHHISKRSSLDVSNGEHLYGRPD